MHTLILSYVMIYACYEYKWKQNNFHISIFYLFIGLVFQYNNHSLKLGIHVVIIY